jgi:2,3-diketo-5-methylthio-1-phosphopentane phosphatase
LNIRPSGIFCDFDGTITKIDGTDAILERFAAPEWRDWELLWRLGEITSQTCLSRQIELIDADSEDILHFAASLPIDEGVYDLDRLCRAYHIPLAILSDGLDLVIRAVLRKHNLLHIPVLSNRLHLNRGGVPTLSYPYADQNCSRGAGTCKCALAKPPLKQDGPVIYIGDGRSDFCVATKVDMVYAKGELLSWCRHENIKHQAFKTLSEAAEYIFPKEIPVL